MASSMGPVIGWFARSRSMLPRTFRLQRLLLFSIYLVTLCVLLFCVCTTTFSRDLDYCAPSTPLDDTECCRLETIEKINDAVHHSLEELLSTSFFRYYKINLSRPCPFWSENPVCSSQGCTVETLEKDPNGWEARLGDISFPTFQFDRSVFRAWEYDDDDFCLLDREGEAGVYVDLIENPERFTGYTGPSANKIWQSIYEENCFSGNSGAENPLKSKDWQQCVERKVFYRVVSGLHASVSVHLCDQYYNQKTKQWESNLELFHERVGKYLDRVQNLYLVHMLLYRAICKISPRLQDMNFNLNEPEEDARIKLLVGLISKELPKCPDTFDHAVFSSNSKPSIVEEFKDHFRNASRIMDCVSCERCRLWGKIQTTGIGTALKILFLSEDPIRWDSANFRRSEIIALFNTMGRFSESILAVQKFRELHTQQKSEDAFVSNLLQSVGLILAHPAFVLLTGLAMIAFAALALSARRRYKIKAH